MQSLPKTQGLRSSGLRRPLGLQLRGCRLWVEADGSVRSFHSLREKRALFGFEQLSFSKVQAGIVVHAQRPDWGIRPGPRSVQFAGRIFGGVEVAQSLDFLGRSVGYLRKLKLKNGGQAPIRIRVLSLLDPTAAHFGYAGTWGALGVNAFNRGSHVAMDEVSDPPSARVVGASPPPSKYYMTASTSRALEVMSAGELPDGTAGMSGQGIVLGSHEVDLSPGESREVTYASIYTSGKLEDALAEFGRIQSGERQDAPQHPLLACSQREATDAGAWALPAIEGGAYADDRLDRLEALRALTYTDPGLALGVLDESRSALRKEGSLPHSLDPAKAGVLETSLLLSALANHLVLAQDKKLARAHYPAARKLAGCLLSASKDFGVPLDPTLPQGWRRRLGSGYPAGEVPEVSLAVAGALSAASQLGRMLAKSADAAKFRERSEMIADHVRKKLVDERGFLSLCRDSSGRLRSDDTVDMALAGYRHQFMASAEQAAAHRLLEKDFDTPYGPRSVPTTNQVYFNSSYGDGQLGGVWTRAPLAHALLCYRGGLPGMGSLALGKVARLVADEVIRLGGSPGEFPLWLDPDGRAVHGDGSDPVAAARFLETLLEGELGLCAGADGASLAPAASSGLSWVGVCDLWVGAPFAAFLGRSTGATHLFYAGGRVTKPSGGHAGFERLETQVRGVFAVSLHSPGQVICLGNSLPSPARLTVRFPARAAELAKRLSTPLEAYGPASRSWDKIGSLRVSPAMSFEASLEPNGWKVFRVSSA